MHVRSVFAAAAFVATLFAAAPSGAAVMTFDALPGANRSPFTSYTESGLTLERVSGGAFVITSFGNPVPSVGFGYYLSRDFNSSEFRLSAASAFVLNSIDFASNNGDLQYTITGFRNGGQAWSVSSTLLDTYDFGRDSFAFVNLVFTDPTAVDYVTLRLYAGGTTANFDNISVDLSADQVPEPTSLVFIALGLAAARLARRPTSR